MSCLRRGDMPGEFPVEVLERGKGPTDVIKSKIISPYQDDPFYVVDVGGIVRLYEKWRMLCPNIKPFYAVKCNNDPVLLKVIAELGAGFDCASKGEIQTILDLGVSTDRIIYANPCKQISHILFAAEKNVSVMTFDNVLELGKISAHFPAAKLVVRIRADDPNAQVQHGMKFGCSVPEACDMLNVTKKMSLNVIGVSFHVGSLCQTPAAFRLALEKAYKVFQYADSIGYHFSLLDIGGGFPGSRHEQQSLLPSITSTINTTIDTLFSVNYPSLDIISEPGNYFGCSPFTLAVCITSKRACRPLTDNGGVLSKETGEEEEKKREKESIMYYLNDGVYGSFINSMFGPFVIKLKPLQAVSTPPLLSSLWGPTCAGMDKICVAKLPELSIGDWLYQEELGAYTLSARSDFNCFYHPEVFYYMREEDRSLCEEHGVGIEMVSDIKGITSLQAASKLSFTGKQEIY